ncbi:MAG: IPT/TIG domain-containing protein, partial [Myxococcota bacterium]
MARSSKQLLSVLLASLVATAGCEEPPLQPTSEFAFPDELRLWELPASTRSLISATLKIEGVLPTTPLTLSPDLRFARGRFPLEDADEGTHPFELQVSYDDEVLLAEATGKVQIVAQKTNSLVPQDGFVTCEPVNEDDDDCGGRFDLNRNGFSNLADLLGECPEDADGCDSGPREPRTLGALLDVAPSLLQFPSGLPLGSFGRQVILIENLADHEVTLDARVVGAPGVTLSRFDLRPDPDDAALPRLEPLTLQAYEQLFLAVSYAPTNRYFTAGEILLDVQDPPSMTRQSVTVSVVGNADGELRTPPESYAPTEFRPTADLGGFGGEVQVFAKESLFAGLPTPQIQSLVPQNDRMRFPARNAAGELVQRSLNADAVLLVEVPGRHRLNLRLGGLSDDIDLTWILLDDDDAISDDPDEVVRAWRGGMFPEALQYRNPNDTTRRGLVVLGRRDVDDGSATPNALTEAVPVPVELTGLLTDAPEFTERPSPRRGPVEGGTRVRLTGRGFSPGALVTVGGRGASECVHIADETGQTSLTCTTPPGNLIEGSNPATIVVQNPSPAAGGDGQAATLVEGFLYEPPAPTLSSLRPAVAPASGSDGTITIRGEHFLTRNGPPVVHFGEVAASDVIFVDPTWLEVVAPPQGTSGEVKLQARNRLDPMEGDDDTERLSEPSNALLFLYTTPVAPAPTLSAVRPAGEATTCTVDAACAIELVGTGFVDGMLVNVGGLATLHVEVGADATTATAVTAAFSTIATRAVEVITPDGQRARLDAGISWSFASLSLGAVVPSLIPTLGGASLDVYGAGFREGARAYFVSSSGSEFPATQTSRYSSTLLRVLTPALAAGVYGLRVGDNDGGSVSSTSAVTVVEPQGEAPRIDVITPATAALGLGAVTVTLQGRDFRSPSVFIGEQPVPVEELGPNEDSGTLVRLVLPAATTPGNITLRLVNSDGTTDSAAFTWLSPEETKVSLVLPDTIHSRVKGETLKLVGAGLLEADEAVVLRTTGSSEETLFAARIEEQSDTSLVVGFPQPLADLGAAGGSYRVDLRREGALLARSPSFFARDPRVVATLRTELGITLFGENLHPSAFVEAEVQSVGSLIDATVRKFIFVGGTDTVVQLEAVNPVALVPGANYQLAIYHDIDPADGVVEKTSPVLVELDPTGVATGALAVSPLLLEVPDDVLPANAPLPVVSAFLPSQAGLPSGATGLGSFGTPDGFELSDGQGAVVTTGTWSSNYDPLRAGHVVTLSFAPNALLNAGDYRVRLKTTLSADLADSSSLLPVRAGGLISITPTTAIPSMRATLTGSFFDGDIVLGENLGNQRVPLNPEERSCTLSAGVRVCTASVALDELYEGTWRLCRVPAHIAASTATCPTSSVVVTVLADACDASYRIDGAEGGFFDEELSAYAVDPCTGALVRAVVVDLNFQDSVTSSAWLQQVEVHGIILPPYTGPVTAERDEGSQAAQLQWHVLPDLCGGAAAGQCLPPDRYRKGAYQLLVRGVSANSAVPPRARFTAWSSARDLVDDTVCIGPPDADGDGYDLCGGECSEAVGFTGSPVYLGDNPLQASVSSMTPLARSGSIWSPAGIDDYSPADIRPQGVEVCDGLDNDCDLLVDNLRSRCLVDPALEGACRVGREFCLRDETAGPQCEQDLFPGQEQEVCDDLADNDCDGFVDDADPDGCVLASGLIPYSPRDLANATPLPLPGVGTPSLSLLDPQTSAVVNSAVPLGFTFPFFGRSYSEVYITPHGYLSFEKAVVTWPGSSCATYGCPLGVSGLGEDNGAPGALVAAAWGYLSALSVKAVLVGEEFVVEWFFDDGTVAQVVLHPAGYLELHHRDPSGYAGHVQGIVSPGRSVVQTLPGRASGLLAPATSIGVRFVPPAALAAATCGDGICSGPLDCPDDCDAPASCGNGWCEVGEEVEPGLCPSDCGYDRCGDGVCNDGVTDPGFSGRELDLAERDPNDLANTAGSWTCRIDCHCGNGICEDGLTDVGAPDPNEPNLGEN